MPTPWQPPDLDEIRPDRFVINNDKVRPLLKGEGVTVGKFFELVTWRRDGLIARIRARGFNVRTIEDRIAALPAIGPVAPLGEAGVRLLSHPKERIATFDRSQLHWRDLPVRDEQGKPAVQLRDGAALRRRKGRGHADYYIATKAHNNQINLLPAKEADALLHAYAHIAQEGPPAVVHYRQQDDDSYFVQQRQLILPPPHNEVIMLLARDKAEPWTFAAPVLEQVEAIFAKVGVELRPSG